MIAMANAVAKTIDDLLVPSPRWRCLNLVLPLDRLDPESLAVEEVRGQLAGLEATAQALLSARLAAAARLTKEAARARRRDSMMPGGLVGGGPCAPARS